MRGSNSVVECKLPKLDVAGSIPVSRSTIEFRAVVIKKRFNLGSPPEADAPSAQIPVSRSKCNPIRSDVPAQYR
jgi:hypothetical protein